MNAQSIWLSIAQWSDWLLAALPLAHSQSDKFYHRYHDSLVKHNGSMHNLHTGWWKKLLYSHYSVYEQNNQQTVLLLLSLSKTLADLLMELECVTDRSALVKASESECSIPASISDICTSLSALKNFSWKYTIICCTTDGGQPDSPAVTGGSDISCAPEVACHWCY